MKRILRHPRTLALGGRALGAYLRFSLRTSRWTVDGRDTIERYFLGEPAIFAFWHESLPLMPALWTAARRERADPARGPMHVLVSRHSDGRLIGDIMRRFGVTVVHGSSTRGKSRRGGAASLRALLHALHEGGQVVITPDGPRGPARQAAPGVAQLASLAGTPIVPCAARARHARRLGTWDGMWLPVPLDRGVLVCGRPIAVPRHGWQEALGPIEAAMTEAAERAERLCLA